MSVLLQLLALGAVFCGTSQAAAVSHQSVMHPVFKGAGRQEGLQIWRIVNFEPEPIDKKEFGKFFEGDSYVVLSTKEDKSKKGTFTWDIFFWLGSKTSQDESGAAAILSVELDDSLGGGPVQHREVQEHESQQFLSLFKPAGVRYLKGGAASGFHHVDINAPGEKRLYQVKGKKNIRVKQVAPDVKSMNKGDCFILDSGRDIFVYVGEKSKGQERLKAISAANQIRDQDHAGRGKVNVVDASSTQVEVQQFFTELGSGSPSQVANPPAADDDLDFEKNQDATVTLYKISDASGKLVSEKISQKPLKQSMLKTEDCFILDTVTSGIYIWVGKKSTVQEKVKALEQGQTFLTNNKYPQWTKMRRVVEGAEPSAFREYFSEWRDSQLTGGLGRGSSPSRRVRSVGSRQCGIAKGFMPDKGEGELQIWRVENLKLAPVEKENYGIFFNGDSYVIKYAYENGRKFIIYFWQGVESTNDEKAVSAIEAVRLDSELGGKALQVRVEQGHEPAHFIKIFHGKMVILKGGVKSGFRNLKDVIAADTSGLRLFQVFGTCKDDVRAIQVPHESRSLNTNDVFFLETPTKAYLWVGAHCNEAEEAIGSEVKSRLCPDKEVEKIREGEEPAEFWASLGGKSVYTTEVELEPHVGVEPRLFHCYIHENKNRFIVEQMFDYSQEDLYPDDVMILDAGEIIYLWLGRDSSVEEKQNSHKLIQTYVKVLPQDKHTVVTIKQGQEPEGFKQLFDKWNDNYWSNLASLDDIRTQVNEIENV